MNDWILFIFVLTACAGVSILIHEIHGLRRDLKAKIYSVPNPDRDIYVDVKANLWEKARSAPPDREFYRIKEYNLDLIKITDFCGAFLGPLYLIEYEVKKDRIIFFIWHQFNRRDTGYQLEMISEFFTAFSAVTLLVEAFHNNNYFENITPYPPKAV